MRLAAAMPWIANGALAIGAIASAAKERDTRESKLAELPEDFRAQVAEALRHALPSHVPMLRELAELLAERGYETPATAVRERLAELEPHK